MRGNKKGAQNISSATTLISKETRIVGDVYFSGNLDIEGTIEGNVIAHEGQGALLRVVENGRIEGDISSPTVYINGTVVGNVKAPENLELASKASVSGNVQYTLVEVAVGAQVNGALKHIDSVDKDAPVLAAVSDD